MPSVPNSLNPDQAWQEQIIKVWHYSLQVKLQELHRCTGKRHDDMEQIYNRAVPS